MFQAGCLYLYFVCVCTGLTERTSVYCEYFLWRKSCLKATIHISWMTLKGVQKLLDPLDSRMLYRCCETDPGLCDKTSQTEASDTFSEGYIIIYAGGNNHQWGVSTILKRKSKHSIRTYHMKVMIFSTTHESDDFHSHINTVLKQY